MNTIQEFKKFLIENDYNNSVLEEKGKIKVGGSLYLRGTQITSLPDNLTVGGYLDLEGTQITKAKSLKKLVKGYCKERNYI